MRTRLHLLSRDERGMSLVFLGVCMAAFIAMATLAIDVGMLVNARTQAQTAADSGALAGVTALVYNDFNNRSESGPAVQSAISAGKKNFVMGAAPTIAGADVTFPVSPTGLSNRVSVAVHRMGENAVPTLMGAFFGMSTSGINAVATAEASPANAMTCVKPFMIPDKWDEMQTPPWDTGDTFDYYDKKGNKLDPADWYVPVRNCPTCKDNTGYTGYTVKKDKGMRLVLRAGTGDNINPSFYYSWKMPGDTGGDFYRDNIAHCNTSVMHWFDYIVQEPGDMSGPTIQGVQALIDQDPSAYWEPATNGGCNCVKGSKFSGQSPRVFPIPLYDPQYYADGKKNGRVADFRIANFLGFFAEYIGGNAIYGYVTNVTGVVDLTTGPAPAGMFPVSIRLVE